LRNYFKYLIYLYVLIGFNGSFAGSYDDFFKAIELDQPEVVSQLLARGFDPNSPNPKGIPALILTYQKKSFKVLDVLVDWKTTNLNVQSAAGENLLMLAAINNQLSLADKLISKGADVNKPGWTPLHYAASKGLIDMIRLLLEQQAYLDAESPNGTTPLMMAANYGSPMAVKLLLEEGADPRLRNKLGLSAIDMVKQAEKADSKRYLQAFLVAWEQKYAKPEVQNNSTSIQATTPEPEMSEPATSLTQETKVNDTTDDVNLKSPETNDPGLSSMPVSEQETQAVEAMTKSDSETLQKDASEEELQEVVTGPGLQTTNIETQTVEPVIKLPQPLPAENVPEQTVSTQETPNEPQAVEALKEVVRKTEAKSVGVVRVQPLEPRSKNTSYTKQLQTRRIVTIDIIEVNNEESKPNQ
jgi:hypothetical protein